MQAVLCMSTLKDLKIKDKKSHQEMCVYSLSLPKTTYQSYYVTGQNNVVLRYFIILYKYSFNNVFCLDQYNLITVSS